MYTAVPLQSAQMLQNEQNLMACVIIPNVKLIAVTLLVIM